MNPIAFRTGVLLASLVIVAMVPGQGVVSDELYWGGQKQDSVKRTIEHVYSSTPGGMF